MDAVTVGTAELNTKSFVGAVVVGNIVGVEDKTEFTEEVLDVATIDGATECSTESLEGVLVISITVGTVELNTKSFVGAMVVGNTVGVEDTKECTEGILVVATIDGVTECSADSLEGMLVVTIRVGTVELNTTIFEGALVVGNMVGVEDTTEFTKGELVGRIIDGCTECSIESCEGIPVPVSKVGTKDKAFITLEGSGVVVKVGVAEDNAGVLFGTDEIIEEGEDSKEIVGPSDENIGTSVVELLDGTKEGRKGDDGSSDSGSDTFVDGSSGSAKDGYDENFDTSKVGSLKITDKETNGMEGFVSSIEGAEENTNISLFGESSLAELEAKLVKEDGLLDTGCEG